MPTERIVEGGVPYQHEGGTPLVLLPRREVERRVGLSRTTIYQRMAAGTFPAAVHDIDSATVWWLEHEITGWIRARVEARDRARMQAPP